MKLPGNLVADIGYDKGFLYTIYEIFERETYGMLDICSDDTVLDCGATIGCFSLYASSRGAKIVAVEPSSRNYRFLERNISLNMLSNKIIPVKKAVFSSSKPLKLHLKRYGVWHTLFDSLASDHEAEEAIFGYEMVECTTIDQLEEDLNVEFDIIKMDVEGAELEALKGGANTLDHVREMMIEYHSERLHEDITKFLLSKGSVVNEVEFNYDFKAIIRYILLNFRQMRHLHKPDIYERTFNKSAHDLKSGKRGMIYARAERK